ncbi:MAG: Flp pilus assembly protein CpaB [Bacillota bacterium]
MKSNLRLLIVAVIFGLLTVGALNLYLQRIRQPAYIEETKTEVVVAVKTIPVHTRITADMLATTSLPAESVHPDVIRNTMDAVGAVTRSEIIQGEQVLAGRIVTNEQRTTLSYRIPENMRAIAIPVNEVTGVAGYISVGDKVDVIVSYQQNKAIAEEPVTYTVFQNIGVLAVGNIPVEKDGQEPQLVGTITLSVSPAQAEVLAFAFLNGSFHLTLRSPTDYYVVDLDSYSPANFDTFRKR